MIEHASQCVQADRPRSAKRCRADRLNWQSATLFLVLLLSGIEARAATYSGWVWTCAGTKTTYQPFGRSTYSPDCSTTGVWQHVTWVDQPVEVSTLDTILGAEWNVVIWAFGAGVFMWAVGLGIGLIINVVRKTR